MIVGAPTITNNFDSEGRVYLYLGADMPSGLQTDTGLDASTATATWAVLGTDVATAGDVNADGYDDVIIGAPDLHQRSVLRGRGAGLLRADDAALLGDLGLPGSARATRVTPSLRRLGGQRGRLQRRRLRRRDRRGRHLTTTEIWNEGAVFLYYGSFRRSGRNAPDVTYEVDQEDARFGTSVAALGDVHFDGY